MWNIVKGLGTHSSAWSSCFGVSSQTSRWTKLLSVQHQSSSFLLGRAFVLPILCSAFADPVKYIGLKGVQLAILDLPVCSDSNLLDYRWTGCFINGLWSFLELVVQYNQNLESTKYLKYIRNLDVKLVRYCECGQHALSSNKTAWVIVLYERGPTQLSIVKLSQPKFQECHVC